MIDDILEIRSNITPMITRLARLEAERLERERLEREERMERERKEREERANNWKKEHPVLDKYTYISYYNYDTYSWQGDYCNVHFYEWSNANVAPKKFPYTIGFFRFLDDCKIMPTQADVDKIKRTSGCHIICKPGSKELIVGETYDKMVTEFNTCKALEAVPTVNNVPRVISYHVNNNIPVTYP